MQQSRGGLSNIVNSSSPSRETWRSRYEFLFAGGVQDMDFSSSLEANWCVLHVVPEKGNTMTTYHVNSMTEANDFFFNSGKNDIIMSRKSIPLC